jgi:hypothetical protein
MGIILGSRIRIRAKSWIRMRIKVKIQELWRLKLELYNGCRDAYNYGLEAQNRALEGLWTGGRRLASI